MTKIRVCYIITYCFLINVLGAELINLTLDGDIPLIQVQSDSKIVFDVTAVWRSP